MRIYLFLNTLARKLVSKLDDLDYRWKYEDKTELRFSIKNVSN